MASSPPYNSTTGIDPDIHRAAIKMGQCDASKLQEAQIHNVTQGKENTLLHLAAAAGNVDFINKLLQNPRVTRELVRKTNIDGNTPLHEAAQGGHQKAVEVLLLHDTSLINIPNNLNQMAVFKACESGDLSTVKTLAEADPSTLSEKAADNRTCLHVAVNPQDKDLLEWVLKAVRENHTLIKQKDKNGNTVLHLAVKRNSIETVKLLLSHCQPDLCYSRNCNKETPLCMAAKLGFLEIVIELINCRPDSLEMRDGNGKNVLHLAVEHRHVNVVEFLTQKGYLSQLINQPVSKPPKNKETQDVPLQGEGTSKDNDPYSTKKNKRTKHLKSEGSTPLHIAASIKHSHMVELLLKVPGLNKNAINKEGLTPLDIAKDNTEYHEPYKIIEKLTSYPLNCKPFLYKAPTVSEEKHAKAIKIVEKAYSDRRNTELVVAVLLATMAFSAVFQIPGGFQTESPSPSPASTPAPPGQEPLGSPVLIGYNSFKLFLIFDSVAFFLSLFVVLMWTVSSPLVTGDLMLFMCITGAVTCTAFDFVTYGFMCAVYTMLAYKHETLAWVILGSSVLICLAGNVACLYIFAKFLVNRARFHRLCGTPRLLDHTVEFVWNIAEKMGVLEFIRRFQPIINCVLTGNRPYLGQVDPPVQHEGGAERASPSKGGADRASPSKGGQEHV